MRPPDLDWFVWRLVLSESISDSLVQILNEWTLDQAADAHDALNYMECLAHEVNHGRH